jgi:tetratricopeptide (TPR) repeat protein
MDAVTAVAPQRHPWLDRLIAAPGPEMRALVEGTASIHPHGRGEPSDAAATLLFGLAIDDPAVRAFDQGTLEILKQYRQATAHSEGSQRDRLALAAMDLMTVVKRLTPHDTVVDLHRRFAYWNGWAETLVLDRGLDLRREYWRVLALSQDVAAGAGLAPRRLLPFWLDICGEAGRRGRFDESYLAIGLLGLRSLPLGEEAANEEATLHGLARWADAQRPAKARFLREWHVLEGAFPRDPTFWTDLVARVLASVEQEISRVTNNSRDAFPAATWWREDVESIKGVHLELRAAELEPPPREQRQALLADISAGKPFQMLEPRVRALMQRHERYAIRTGDAFYVVRSACNVGMSLLRGGDALAQRAAHARELARLALRFEPANVYAWALWRDSLAAEGYFEAAELLGWETIRRFPENPQWRTQLALLVDQLGRPQDAEALLRETLEVFSDDITVFNQLANVVGRETERLKEAIIILQQALILDPTDEIALRMKSSFERGETSVRTRRVASAANAADSPLPADLAASARMRRALFRVRTAEPAIREDAKREVESILREDENLAYSRYVATAAGVIPPTANDTIIAAAYLAAAREGSAVAMRSLFRHAHGIEGVILSLAGSLRGDEDATKFLKIWTGEPANDLSPRDKDLRAIATRTAMQLPDDLVGDMLAASLGMALAA